MKVITYMQGVLNETNEDSAHRRQLVVLVVGQLRNSNQHLRKLPLNLGNVHQSMLLSLLLSLQVWHRILEETVASARCLGLLELHSRCLWMHMMIWLETAGLNDHWLQRRRDRCQGNSLGVCMALLWYEF